ncbi:hypothetical protein A0H81_01587 [Grifola frondosa]|uniref:Uncharacterized protein n=1 Tax=Grifola frondosa TaxID=5627 RepID=A0A1C7MLZ0_GRIFR|nr:hypothetical protein A0H81_01587 [Grifola frondosa]
MSSVNCQGRVLEVARLRTGLDKIYTSVTDRINHLTNNVTIPVNIPVDFAEDLTDDTVGYSWLSHGSFTQKTLPLLEVLFSHPDYSIGGVDAYGMFRWHRPGLMALRHELGHINRELAILCFILPAPPPRGTEFADTRLSNAQIPRNVYKDFGTWFIHHRTKTSGLTKSLSWVPTLCPKKLQTLLDWYCAVVRPVECLLAQILDEDGSLVQHEEYLWMQDGKHMNSEKFSHVLERTTQEFMGCGLSLHYWRHIAISIMREFIPSDIGGDHFGDTLSNHSTNQARQTYAREVGKLPFLQPMLCWRAVEFASIGMMFLVGDRMHHQLPCAYATMVG